MRASFLKRSKPYGAAVEKRTAQVRGKIPGGSRKEIEKKEGNVKAENKKASYRRVVTAEVQGKSVIQSNELLENYNFETVPGYIHRLVWANLSIPDLSQQQKMDSYPESVVPGPGGTSFHIVTFPPGSVFKDPSFDGNAAHKEALSRLRGLRTISKKKTEPCTRQIQWITPSFSKARYGSNWTREKPFISRRAMSSSRMVLGTHGETKEQRR